MLAEPVYVFKESHTPAVLAARKIMPCAFSDKSSVSIFSLALYFCSLRVLLGFTFSADFNRIAFYPTPSKTLN